jgi:DNA polymerase-2
MNSFYGVLGTEACRFADERLVNAITGFGRELLLWAQRWFEERGYRVLYGDTDSLFVESGAPDGAAAFRTGNELCEQFNQELTAWIEERWALPSRITLEFEKLYLRLLLPKMKGGTGGARKRYAGLIAVAGAEPTLSFTGMEVVRRDWTALARRTQREIYRRLFADEDLTQWLREIVEQLRAGAFDDELVYRKSLRRALSQYTRQTPPHVVAARKLPGKPPRVIHYVITTAGAEPVDLRSAPLDREHYVQKQIRGVAEPLLDLIGLSFDVVIGDDRQQSLF